MKKQVRLGGIFGRWKQIVGYEFTAASYDGHSVKERLHELVGRAAEAGAKVRVITCDMGNRHVWAEFGIECGPSVCVNSIPHPCFPDERLYFMPDPVHVFKNCWLCLPQMES